MGPAVGLKASILDDYMTDGTEDITRQDGGVLPSYPPNVTMLVEMDETILDVILLDENYIVLWDVPLDAEGNVDPGGTSKTGLPTENLNAGEAAVMQRDLRGIGVQANRANDIVDTSKTRQEISDDLTEEQRKYVTNPYDANTLWLIDPSKKGPYNSGGDLSIDGGDVRTVPDVADPNKVPPSDAVEVVGRQNRSTLEFDLGGKGFPAVHTMGGFDVVFDPALTLNDDFHFYFLVGATPTNAPCALITTTFDPLLMNKGLHLLIEQNRDIVFGTDLATSTIVANEYTPGEVKLFELMREGNANGNLLLRLNGDREFKNIGVAPPIGALPVLVAVYPENILDEVVFGEAHIHNEVMKGRKLAEAYGVTEYYLGIDLLGMDELRNDVRRGSVDARQVFIDELVILADGFRRAGDRDNLARTEQEIARQTRLLNATNTRIT